MIKTELCDILGIKHPIIQAGMGPFGTNNLCVASSNAGVLGLISSSALVLKDIMPDSYDHFIRNIDATNDDDISTVLSKILKWTADKINTAGAIYGVNVMVSAELAEGARIIIQTMINCRKEYPAVNDKLKVIVTSAGDPLPMAEMIKPSGMKWLHVVSSVKAAKRCQKAGVDAIVVSGHEGGFHIAWEPVHTMTLLPAVVDAVPDIPVVGAGGFCDGKTLAAALALGAAGVQMGTRFLTTKESDFVQLWKDKVIRTEDRGTLVARGFVGPARFLKTPTSQRHAEASIEGSPGVFLGKPDDMFSIPPELLTTEIEGMKAAYTGDLDKAIFAAGECAQRIDNEPSVQELVDTVVKEALNTINNLANKYIE